MRWHGRRALAASVINVDETHWAIMGSPKLAAGTVWGVHAPGVAFYRILPGKSADEGREVLADYTGIVVVDGFAVSGSESLDSQARRARYRSRCSTRSAT